MFKFLTFIAGRLAAFLFLGGLAICATQTILAADTVAGGQATSFTAVAYSNPVYAGSMPDPSVIRHGDWYYAYGTTGKSRLKDGCIFTTLRSRDLVNWEKLGGALVPPSEDRQYQYWAPEVTEAGGKFYLYYSMGKLDDLKFELRVATSDKPEGPFTDVAKLTDCENNRFTIDAYPFRDDDGQWYLFYAKDFIKSAPGEHPGTALVVDRLVDMTRLAGECQVVVRARHDWTLFEANRRMEAYGDTFDWHTIEGPCVVRHGGKYYCFYSGANFQTARYGVDYVVADHPMGPYRNQGDHARVLSAVPGKVRGPGHHSVIIGPDNKNPYFVYHAWDSRMKTRQMCIDKLEWTSEGPVCKPTVTTQTLRLGEPYYIAHRGEYMALVDGKGEVDAPEGSRPTYERVRDRKVNAVKVDLHYTADKVIVVSHDPNLKRTTGHDLPIIETQYETLKNTPFLKVGSFENERILTLDEALKILKDCPLFYLDFKYHTPEMMTAAFEIFEANGIPRDRIILATFTTWALEDAQKRYPDVRRVLHIHYKKKDDAFLLNGKVTCADFDAVKAQMAAWKKELGLYGYNLPTSSPRTTPEFIRELKADGSWVSIWYVHALAAAEKYQDAGVDGYVTGLPSALKSALEGGK